MNVDAMTDEPTDPRWAPLSVSERIRLRLGSWVMGGALWQRLCAMGCCPQGVHQRWQELRMSGYPWTPKGGNP